MRIQEEIQNQLAIFNALCQKHQVKYLYAFGSATTNKFDSI